MTSSGDLVISNPAIGGTVSDGTVTWIVMKNLPLSGGVMIGDVIKRNANTSSLNVYGGTSLTDGASISVFGNNALYNAGKIVLRTQDTDPQKTEHYLIMNRDGVLGYDSKNLGEAAIVARSISVKGYIKYASGLIIQWGMDTASTTMGNTYFPIAFSDNGSYQVFGNPISTAHDSAHVWKNTYIAFYKQAIVNDTGFSWFAIGY